MASAEDIAAARAAADKIRPFWPEKAAEIDALIAKATAGGLESSAALKVNVSIRFRLEKFDGEYEPGKQPVEVIEGTDNL